MASTSLVIIVISFALFFVISNSQPLDENLSMAAAVDGMKNRVEKRMNWQHYHPHHHQSQNDSEKRRDGEQEATEAEQFKSNQ